MNDLIIETFREQQSAFLDLEHDNIIKAILNSKEELNFIEHDLDINDANKKSKNKDYKKNLKIDIYKNNLTFIFFSINEWNKYKNYINTNIKSLTLPLCVVMEDLEYLSNFKNLTTLKLSDYGVLDFETLKKISQKTNIKNIEVKNCYFDYSDYLNEKDLYGVYSTVTHSVYYKDIVLKANNYEAERKTIYASNLDLNKINSIINNNLNSSLKYIDILTLNSTYRIKNINVKNKTIETLLIEDSNLKQVIEMFNYLNKDFKIENIEIDLSKIDYSKLDLNVLHEMCGISNVTIKYGQDTLSSLDEFKGLKESIKWYKKLINSYDLSPVEKLLFAYDILKTFKYVHEKDNPMESREPHKIIISGSIVCVGYTSLLKEIVNYLSDNLKVSSVSVTCYDNDKKYLGGHQRNIALIDDDKYNIHGYYILDPTWDSIQENVSKITKEDYTALDLYNYFLIPIKDYNKTFKKDSMPSIILLYKNSNDDFEARLARYHMGHEIFDCYNLEKTKEYLEADRPSLEIFSKILLNVRMAEGYTKEEAVKEVEKVNKINMDLIEYRQTKDNDSIEYFEELGNKI